MRFVNIFAVLAAVAGTTSALRDVDTRGNHDLVDRDDGAYDAEADRLGSDTPFSGAAVLRDRAAAAAARTKRGSTTTTGKTPTCNQSKRRGELSRRTKLAELYDREWWVFMGESCPANIVEKDETISIMDISGCSGLFFFSDAGKTSAYHITAGEESSEALAAARSADDAGTTNYYSIYAASKSKITEIENKIKSVLPNVKEHKTVVYTLNTDDKDERHRFDNTPGSKDVTVSTYDCS